MPDTKKSKDFIVEGIAVINRDYRILRVNEKLLKMLGVAKSDVLGKFCYATLRHKERPCWEVDKNWHCPLDETVKAGKSFNGIHKHYDNQGKEKITRVSTLPIKNGNNNIIYIMLFFGYAIERKRSVTPGKSLKLERIKDEITQIHKLITTMHDLFVKIEEIENELEKRLGRLSQKKIRFE